MIGNTIALAIANPITVPVPYPVTVSVSDPVAMTIAHAMSLLRLRADEPRACRSRLFGRSGGDQR